MSSRTKNIENTSWSRFKDLSCSLFSIGTECVEVRLKLVGVCRGVLALGTFISGPGSEEVRQLARDLDCGATLKRMGNHNSPKIVDAALEALRLLQN